MKAYLSDKIVTLYHGNALDVLAALPAQSVNCCVTSPPYWGLRDYGHADQIGLEPTPDAYVAEMVKVFREVRRVMRDDGTLWLNLGDTYNAYNGGSAAGGPVGLTQSALRPKLPAGHGLTAKGLKSKDLCGIPWSVAFALRADGWYLRQDIIWHKPNPMPESVTDRCTKSHEYIFLLSKSATYYYDAEAIAEEAQDRPQPLPEEKTIQRHGTAWHNNAYAPGPSGFGHGLNGTRNRRSVWTVATKPYSGAHFATFPPDLINPCIMAGCPNGGTVLDPFFGAGTTGLVCQKQGVKCIGIELNEKYCAIAARRLAQGVLFGASP